MGTITKQGLANLKAELSKAIELLDERSLTEFQKFKETLPKEDNSWVDDDLFDFLEENDVEVDDFDNYYGSDAAALQKYIEEGMENDGVIGYFPGFYRVFRALFAKHPELLTNEED